MRGKEAVDRQTDDNHRDPPDRDPEARGAPTARHWQLELIRRTPYAIKWSLKPRLSHRAILLQWRVRRQKRTFAPQKRLQQPIT